MTYFHLRHDQQYFLFHFHSNFIHPLDNFPFLIFPQTHPLIPPLQLIPTDSKSYAKGHKISFQKLNSLYHQNALQKNL